MKHLMKILTIYRRVLLIAAFSTLPLMAIAAPAYALTPISQFAVNAPITCPGGPSLKQISTSPATGGGERCFVTVYVDPFVKVLAGLVAVFVTLSIIIAGIQYSAAADDASKVGAAKNRIRNALIALLAYIFLLAFVRYLLPGGI
jgi:hypothetical protein